MAVEIRLVSGPQFAAEASSILSAAWPPPSLRYTPEYLRWQMSFPGTVPAPAAMALVDSIPVGFAASTHRRLRFGSEFRDFLLVSFVGVHPDFWGRGIAKGLYHTLLAAVAATHLPVLTFAQPGSTGQKVIEQAYPLAGFQIRPLGAYPTFACAPDASLKTDWVLADDGSPVLRDAFDQALDECAADTRLMWSAPSEEQQLHYRLDPRPRVLLRLGTGNGTRGLAFIVENQYITRAGVSTVTTLDCVWLRHNHLDQLPALAAALARLRPSLAVINVPSLGGFDVDQLRKVGFRQIALGWAGYEATADGALQIISAQATNLEIV